MAPQVNGETPSSAFISHLTSYPVVHDSISTFKSNPYGQRSIDLTTTSYEKFGKPFIPYLQKPYQYVSPYVAKADELGDSTLFTIESKFPAVKKPTDELYSDGKYLVFYPISKGSQGRDYVLGKYNSEVKKTEDQGIFGLGKAVISTGLIVSGEAFQWLSQFLSAKKAEAKETTKEKTNN
ncbi:9d9c25ec-4ed5-4130-88f0-886dfe22d8ea [Sclerotinia trifoliorum]|uniref:9d9c25ec-4ed5-4130-88f0-886dfe22d8ea n=1 Tax=Sclerotinia trifoliorum TaxID=28548 RepID=A0A8H2ZPM9_9HELO|nr:9d9c25ec-4ed5-4130-88f0-886dfe22d8ea [Sclerotinia trifoliorum]